MLAFESVQSKDTHTTNWNDNMKRLRSKSLLQMQLTHRLAAVEEGRKTTKQHMKEYSIDLYDMCSLLWANDNFRSKVKNAVSNSQETNAWTTHDFDLTPSSEMLNHVMMSVEDLSTGDIAGFCEVAC